MVDIGGKRANVDVETRHNPDESINIQSAGEGFENVKGGFIRFLTDPAQLERGEDMLK